jgi:hypothetical protein
MPGDFTNRFDREVLRSQMAELQAKEKEGEKARREEEAVDRRLAEIGAILEKRAAFIRERFPGAAPEPIEGAGFRFAFGPRAKREKGATFSIRARANDSRLAILVESDFEIPDAGVRERDYVSVPVREADIERARKFVEAKLLDFARAYVA